MHLLNIHLAALLLAAGARASTLPPRTADAAVAPRSPDGWISDMLDKANDMKDKLMHNAKPPQLPKRTKPAGDETEVWVYNAGKTQIPARVCPSPDKKCLQGRDFLKKNQWAWVACKFKDPKSKKCHRLFYKDTTGLYYEAGTSGHPLTLLPLKNEEWVPEHMRQSVKNIKGLKECKVGIRYCPPNWVDFSRFAGCAEVAGTAGSCLDGGFYSKTVKGFKFVQALKDDEYNVNPLATCDMYAKRKVTKGGKVVCSGKITVTPPPPPYSSSEKKHGYKWPHFNQWEPKNAAESLKIAGFVCW